MIEIDGKSRLIGLIGWPVSHTLSPVMQNAAAQAAGLNLVYVPLPVRPDQVETAVLGLPALGFLGVNVTVPHKQAVIPYLDKIETGAQAIGAVNTIQVTNPDGQPVLIGHNTDWTGFLADLANQQVEVMGRDCVVLGAGGSARAVVYALLHAGAAVSIVARRPQQATELWEALSPAFPQQTVQIRPFTALADLVSTLTAPLIVNCTPVGMTPHTDRTPWPGDFSFPADGVLLDLVYNPAQTRLMQQATASGARAINGLGMLLWQGAKAFEIWTGVVPDVEVMRHALSSKL